ncbi:MAG: hypothetical protein IJ763_01725 [Lachnospiraceae bacterium]|nr:hypothetical protein [Lachnospiraceae bacterium]
MKIVDAPYVNGFKDKKKNKIIRRIKHKVKANGVYVITSPIITDGIMDIFQYSQLLTKFYDNLRDDMYILGIAKGKKEAKELIVNIVQDMYDAGYEFDVKGFFGI